MKARRRGVSVVEILVAVALVAGVGAALLGTSGGEVRRVAASAERLQASLALEGLREALAGRSATDLRSRGFPAPGASFTALEASLLADFPGVLPDPAAAAGEPEGRRRAAEAAMELTREVFFEDLPGPGDQGMLWLRVAYRGAGGGERALETRVLVR